MFHHVLKPHCLAIASALGAAALVFGSIAPAHGEQDAWPQFRGADGSGTAPGGEIPDTWTDDDYLWKTDVPGQGVGSPVVDQGRAYLIAADADQQQRTVLCVNLQTGEIVWQEAFPLEPHPLHARNTFASSTPYVDASGVYVAWADPQRVSLIALTHDGKVRWNRDLGTWQSQHGFATSPVMLGGKLILLNSQQAEQLKPGEKAGRSRMMAFDPSSGVTLWETSLTATVACYGVPVLRTAPDGRQQVVGANKGDGLFGLDLATGQMVWNRAVFTARCVSSPLVVGDLVIGSAGSGGGGNHLVAVRPPAGANGQATEVYRIDRAAPYVPTSAVVGQRLFMIDDRGVASAIDGASGRVIWSHRLGGNFGASPIVVGKKILAIDLSGQAHVLAAGDTFEQLGEIPLGGPVQATPAYADGCLLIRVGDQLCCLKTDVSGGVPTTALESAKTSRLLPPE